MRPHIGAALAAALLVLALFAHVARAATARVRARAAANACPGANLRPDRANTATVEQATLCLIDRARVAHGMHALKTNRELRAVATSQVKDMIRLDYFSDDRPSGTTPAALIAATRYGRHAHGLSTAESIGWGTGSYATPAQIVTAWLQSPSHREVIFTGEFLEAGVGSTAAVPSRLAQGHAGATYALELARRL